MEWCYQEEQYRDGINFNLQTGSIMDLGIQGKNALLAASTSGLGLACPMAQAREGCIVYINGREAERLEKAQQHISQATGVQASLVQAGINTSAMVKSPRAAKRFGPPQEFADACAFLCSAQAGFISGQNLQLDGGSYPGLI